MSAHALKEVGRENLRSNSSSESRLSSQSPEQLHTRALDVVRDFKRVESELLDILQRIDGQRAFLSLGYPSLFEYAVKALDLTEAVAFSFIRVARKAREIPELKDEIHAGRLTVAKAMRISSVINESNKAEWIQKAVKLPKQELEREVIRVAPELEKREVLRQINTNTFRLHLGLSASVVEKLRRVQTLEASRSHKNLNLEETLERALDEYLKRRDPLKRGASLSRENSKSEVVDESSSMKFKDSAVSTVPGHTRLTPALRAEALRRDGGKCQYMSNKGEKCMSSRFVEVHHSIPLSEGGPNHLENLITLCWSHHHWWHLQNSTVAPSL